VLGVDTTGRESFPVSARFKRVFNSWTLTSMPRVVVSRRWRDELHDGLLSAFFFGVLVFSIGVYALAGASEKQSKDTIVVAKLK